MNHPSKYLTYQEDDFVKDPLFRSWVLAPDEVNSDFWASWLSRYPEKGAVLENARWQMLQLTVAEEEIARERLAAVWDKIRKRKAAVAPAGPAATPQLPDAGGAKVIELFSWKAWQQMAAVWLLAGCCAGLLYYYLRPVAPPARTVVTAFGQTRTVVLPDQSQVVLNGNSRLSFGADWSKAQDRQVSLQGEAFFSVTSTPDRQPFRVKLPDGVQVTVLGTRFVVTQRPAKTRVVLAEGKVKLSRQQQQYFGLRTAVRNEAILQPGDLVEVRPQTPVFHKTRVAQPQLYGAFTQQKIIFKNTLLSEIARVLEDTYGYRVTIARPGLAAKRFSGTTPTSDIDMLFSALEHVFQVQVIRKGKHITIK
jgi:ferric-dicitrate binding protein FerR (iron transport regulator)